MTWTCITKGKTTTQICTTNERTYGIDKGGADFDGIDMSRGRFCIMLFAIAGMVFAHLVSRWYLQIRRNAKSSSTGTFAYFVNFLLTM